MREPINLPDLTDNDPCPMGKHKGTKLVNVPNKYLLYIYENEMVSSERLKKYIETNLEAIKELAKREE